jgi:hypothetical protein
MRKRPNRHIRVAGCGGAARRSIGTVRFGAGEGRAPGTCPIDEAGMAASGRAFARRQRILAPGVNDEQIMNADAWVNRRF